MDGKPPRDPVCKIEGCDGSTDRARNGRCGLCQLHAGRQSRYGDAVFVPPQSRDFETRLLSKFDQGEPATCWIWKDKPTARGYGAISRDDRPFPAHVAVWLYFGNEIPDGMELDHVCHNEAVARGECDGGLDCPHRMCVNPAHLRAVPHRENTLAGASPAAKYARRDHCAAGHPYDEANTRWRKQKDGSVSRECRACGRETQRLRRERGL